jgi:uncharacterized membrane protein YcjF (UPF0283 family)
VEIYGKPLGFYCATALVAVGALSLVGLIFVSYRIVRSDRRLDPPVFLYLTRVGYFCMLVLLVLCLSIITGTGMVRLR